MQYNAMTAADGDAKLAAIKDGLLQDSIQKEECVRGALPAIRFPPIKSPYTAQMSVLSQIGNFLKPPSRFLGTAAFLNHLPHNCRPLFRATYLPTLMSVVFRLFDVPDSDVARPVRTNPALPPAPPDPPLPDVVPPLLLLPPPGVTMAPPVPPEPPMLPPAALFPVFEKDIVLLLIDPLLQVVIRIPDTGGNGPAHEDGGTGGGPTALSSFVIVHVTTSPSPISIVSSSS